MNDTQTQKSANKLYTFQEDVRDTSLDNSNIILQAPTGAGKTRASMLPALIGFEKDKQQYPQQLIYGIPMRVLANSFMGEFSKTAQNNIRWQKHKWTPSIQTGECPEDKLFEGQIIFATVDQMLASFLNIPYGLPKRLDNINAGAFIGSYLIFDEVHLYPSKQMFLTVLAMLKMLEGITRFTLMSATLTPDLMKAIAKLLNAKAIYEDSSIPLSEGMFKDIVHLQAQKRKWIAQDGNLTGDAVARALDEGDKILCICNTVERAQEVYRQVQKLEPVDTDYVLLHSRFYQKDRATYEDRALQWLGKKPEGYADDGRRKIVIATQVVEVGLDISADILLTECAPATSLIQRAGRCARWGGKGQVWVYQPPVNAESGEVSYAPYIDDGFEAVCINTWNRLTQSDFDGQVLQYEKEQQLVEDAHGDHDREHLIDGLETKVEMRIEAMLECMRQHQDAMTDTFIRQNSSVPLYIMANHKDPQLTEKPHLLEAFSVSRGRIFRAYKELDTVDPDANFCFAGGEQINDERDSDDLQSKTIYQWKPLSKPEDIYQHIRFLAHPLVVAYDKYIGLEWRNLSGKKAEQSPIIEKNTTWQHIKYNQDTYVEHINGLYRALTIPFDNKGWRPLWEDYAYALSRVADVLQLAVTLDQIKTYLRLTIALHDVGKLNQQWQTWAWAWQDAFAQHHPETKPHNDVPLAHTDTDSAHDKEDLVWETYKAMRVKPRGTHAVESAEATCKLVWSVTGGDAFWHSVIMSAICHHHTPTAESCGNFQMIAHAEPAIIEALIVCGFDEIEAIQWAEQVSPKFPRQSKHLSIALKNAKPSRSGYNISLIYYLFVRILRLADQRSFTYLSSQNRRD